jgi:hypothetical protein
MSEKPDDSFEDEEADDIVDGGDDLDLDRMIRDLDTRKRRSSRAPVGEPAWRKLERMLEDRRTAELLSDFDDYDIGDDADGPKKKARKKGA